MKKQFYIIDDNYPQQVGGGTRLLIYAYIATMCEQQGKCFASIATIANKTRCSADTATRILKELRADGLICCTYLSGIGNEYFIPATPLQNTPPCKIPTPPQNTGETPLQVTGETPLQNTPPKTNIKTNIKTKSVRAYVIEDFCPTDWLPVLQMWLDYKKQRKETYKTENSVKICLKHLQELAGGNIETGRKIVEQAMANNWAGLYALKTQTKPTPAQGTDASEIERIKQQYVQRQQEAQADDIARAKEDKAAAQLAAQEFAKKFKLTY